MLGNSWLAGKILAVGEGLCSTELVKEKCTLVQALRLCTGHTASWGSRGIALLFHDHGTRRGWGISVTPRPIFTPGRTRHPLYRMLDGPQSLSEQEWKISPPPAFDPRTVQPVASRYTDWATRPTYTYIYTNTHTHTYVALCLLHGTWPICDSAVQNQLQSAQQIVCRTGHSYSICSPATMGALTVILMGYTPTSSKNTKQHTKMNIVI